MKPLDDFDNWIIRYAGYFEQRQSIQSGPAVGVGKLGSRLGPPINKVRNYIFSYLFFIFLFHLGPPNSLRLGPPIP